MHLMADTDFLTHFSLFASVEKADLERINAICRPVEKKPGQVIFRKGDEPDAVYLIKKGKIALSTWTEGHEELFLTMLCDGDFFGELSLFDESRRSTGAKAFEECELIAIPREELLALLKKSPDVCISMMREMAARLRTANLLIEQPVIKNVNDEIEHRMTVGDRIADRIARFGGSWPFIGFFFAFILLWVAVNAALHFGHPLDPFPFTMLSLVVSTVAALQAPIILMSQNRQAAQDRIRSEQDYQISLKAETQLHSLHLKVNELRHSELQELAQFQQHILNLSRQQKELLEQLVPKAGSR
jgi:CRP/FNR family cyclic AMP-dependent transcriptional regulator